MPVVVNQEGEQRKRPILRNLRIAFSVGCGILCLLLIALWVRSYWWCDIAYAQVLHTPTLGGISVEGRILCGLEQPGRSGTAIGIESISLQGQPSVVKEIPLQPTPLGFNAAPYSLGWVFEVPHYFAVLMTAAIAALPWRRWRFSLRSLLIGTTVVAVALGLIFAVSR
jgi:hypothetical protein